MQSYLLQVCAFMPLLCDLWHSNYSLVCVLIHLVSCIAEMKPGIQEYAEEKTNKDREERQGEKTEASTEEQQEEGEEMSVSVEAELAQMTERWREQCVINDNLKLSLADEEQRFKVQYTHTFHCACYI